MKRIYLTTVLTCLATIIAAALFSSVRNTTDEADTLLIGFVYEADESTPYTYNFALAEEALRVTWPDNIRILTRSNVLADEAEEPIRDLIRLGCRLLFTNCHSEAFLALASEYPEVQFCQTAYLETPQEGVPNNYHTFLGNLEEGRYVSGIAAGLKLRELIDSGEITPGEAQVGYVAAFHTPTVISGYTAFLLGIRSVAPEAVMRVRYTNSWGSFTEERTAAAALIEEGCVILSQHTDTIGPAVACEEASGLHQVYLIGYNQNMLDVAPATALTSTRINWIPYIKGATEAVLLNKSIESFVEGSVRGTEMSAGFDLEWVEMLELNSHIAVPGTEEQMAETIEAIKKGSLQVLQGADEIQDAITIE